ncbi:conjugal transfer mating-pair stabilization protein TraG [Serratia sp. UGAL515B_01]|uniref:conjugal transfer mating-pair stabilization protein TraG n=1 Tax=Serratia sp. UGAL515B_01 TaxID=2986763 RepID=UPI002952FC35|nr:conjugal transfer mating-pair stabilization protein TraG [Serratia sp. UGAL515B_01]WON75535.1 conjugal transfer mating pair stabilization protein TraG [Serratia sp. UGAL515B_01]
MVLDIWVVTAGAMITMGLNAVAVLVSSDAWRTLFWIAETLGVLVCVAVYIRTHDLRGMFAWGFTFVVVTALLLTPRVTIVVNDLTRPDRIDRVDNVPVGLAAPLWLLTSIGNSVATSYENVFHFPDERAYTKTGMLFASKLMQDSFVMKGQNTLLQDNLNEYIKNCVIPDIQLNRKYTVEDVMKSGDISSIIFSQPSPLRGIYFQNGAASDFMQCFDVAPKLKAALESESQVGGGTFMSHAAAMLPGNRNAQTVYPGMLEGSYEYFFNASKSATAIIKQNVVITGLRRGFNAYSKGMNDTASLVDIASEMSLAKLRLSHAVSYQIASEVMPQLHTIFLLLCIAIFPVMMLALFIKELTWGVVKNYLNFMGSLTLWPVLFAIFNFAVNFSTQGSMGSAPTLSNMNRLMETSSTTAGIAGWLMITIPFISFKLFTSMGQSLANAGSYLGNSLGGAATADSAGVATGNMSMGNVQVDNINGFKRDTNVVNRDGMVTNQLDNGALVTKTPGGQTIYNTRESTSNMAMDLISDHNIASAAQRVTRESQTQTQTALDGYNHSVTQNAASLKQFHDQYGNSDATTLAANTGMSVNDAKRVQEAMSTSDAIMKRNGWNAEQTFTEAQNKNREAAVVGSAKVTGGVKVFGKGVDLSAGVEGRGSSGSSSQLSEGGRSNNEHGRTMTAQEAKTISDGLDVMRNYSVTYNGAHVDNAAAGLMNQISAGLNTSDSKYQQYTDSLSRTHEFQRMASQTDTLSGQVKSNYNQEFVEYVQRTLPQGEAQNILSSSADPEMRERREQLAESFMEDKLRSRLDTHYEQAASHVGDGMETPANVAGAQYGQAYNTAMGDIDGRVENAKIKTDTGQRVNTMTSETQARIDDSDDLVEIDRKGIKDVNELRGKEYDNAGKEFSINYKAEQLHQGSWNPLQWNNSTYSLGNFINDSYKGYQDDAKKILENQEADKK